MVDRVHLSAEERDLLATVRTGLRAKTDQWVAARLALARSLQMPEAPNREIYPRLSKQQGGTELHANQLTGEGREDGEDFTDTFRALLSVFEGRNLFSNEEGFHEALQRHVRRGLREVVSSWPPDTDFMQYLARDLLHDSSSGADASGSGATDADLAQRVLRILGQLGVGATHLGTDEGPRLTRLTLELHQLEDLDRIRKGVGKIAFALGMAQDAIGLNLALVEKRVHLFVPRTPSRWRSVGWPELQPSLSGEAAKGMTLPICLGTDVLGEPFLIDLAEAPHLFIGGTTGSGKSVCLHSILLSLLEGDARAHLVLIDPKAVEFSAYAGSRRLRGPVVTTPEDAQLALESLITEMDNRQERFRELEARNLAEANAKGAGLPRIVAVIDELGDLFMTSKGIDVPLTRLAQKARSAGIHLVLATQRPEAATFPGLLRSNIPSRIALTVQKASESRIILDESGAETLLMRGDMLVRFAGRPTVRAHGCRVESADILKAVANT